MQTPEGPRYQAIFRQNVSRVGAGMCAHGWCSVDKWEGKFEALTSVGAKGAVRGQQDLLCGPCGHVSVPETCARSSKKRQRFFLHRHYLRYWVRLDLDWADFAPVRAKQRFRVPLRVRQFGKLEMNIFVQRSLPSSRRNIGEAPRELCHTLIGGRPRGFLRRSPAWGS